MTEIEKDNEIFDEKIIINHDECCFCKIELTEANKSVYRMHFKTDDNKSSIGCLCLMCKETFERLQGSIVCKPVKNEKNIKKELINEGWTDELLKVKEESEFAVIN
jgi:hypothetical protein